MLGNGNPAATPLAPATETNPIRLAWRKSYPGLAAIGVFSIFINLLKLAAPLYILQILDRVISSRSLETLFMLTLITLVAIATGVTLEAIRRRLFMHWGNWIEHSFGPALFAGGLQKAHLKEGNSSKVLRDMGKVRSFVAGQGLVAWLDVIWAPLFIAIIFLISPLLGSIVLIGGLVALTLGTTNELITRDSRNATFKAGKNDRDLVASAEHNHENIGSLNTVRNLAQRWSHSAFVRLDEGMRARAINVYFAAGIRFVGRLVRIGVLGAGITLVISDETFTLGSVIAANVLGRTAYSLIQSAMLRWREMIVARRAYQNVKTSLRNLDTPRVSRPSPTTPVSLSFEDVGYRYPHQASSVLRGIDVRIAPGELLCVIGPSASGKSTFCRLAAGLIAPRSGKVSLGEVSVYRLQQNSSRREIGYLPQDITLFPGSVRHNIASMAEGDMDLVIEAAGLAGIHNAILNLPDGYDTEITDKEPLLSTGQRKALAVARAFYGAPPLIVLDEPFPHLDALSRSTIMSSIMQLKSRGSVIVFSTQTLEMAKVADKAITILFRNKRHMTLESPEKIAELWEQNEEANANRTRKRVGKNRSRKKKSSVVRMVSTNKGRHES